MSAGEIIAVLDAGPLIHLDELGSLNLLAGYREAIGFQVRGTVGLILRGWRRKQISKATACDLLKALPVKSTLHLRPGFLANVLEQVDHES